MLIDEKTKIFLAKKLSAGAGFRMGGIIFIQLLTIIRIMIFARIFTPEILGTAALAAGSVAIMSVLADWGFKQSVIRSQDKSPDFANTAYALAWIFSLIVFCITIFVAPIFSQVYSSDLTQYIRFLALTTLSLPIFFPLVFWEKGLNFGHPTAMVIVQAVTTLAITIIVQLVFQLGVWSLLIGQVAGIMLSGIYIWVFASYRPSLHIVRKYVRPILAFGGPLMAQGLNSEAMSRGDSLMLGTFAGTTQIAYYNFAWKLPAMIGSATRSIDLIFYPVFARIHDDKYAMERVFNLVNKVWSIIGSFSGVFIIIYADVIVRILFGPDWGPVIPLLRVMTITFIIRYCTGYGYDNLVLVRGKTPYMMKWGFVNTVLLFTVGLLFIREMGAIGGALFWLLQVLLLIPLIRFPIIYKEFGNLDFLHHVWQPLLSGLLAGIFAYLFIQISPWSDPYRTLLSMTIYVTFYLGILIMLDRDFMGDVRRFAYLARS